MSRPLLLGVDLDRTLLPNGSALESPEARPRFAAVAARPEVRLVYVTGRDLGRVEAALAEYGVPRPEVAITDVGTAIHRFTKGEWRTDEEWEERLRAGWRMPGVDEILRVTGLGAELEPQELSRQGPFKMSFYAPPQAGPWLLGLGTALAARGLRCRLVHSVDSGAGRGLLDVIPEGAGKAAAIAFLLDALELPHARAVFAGDSANDLDVLTSGLAAVLVANASDEVRCAAVAGARAAGHPRRLYVARGGFLGMNGNYSAGVLEGLAHFHPETIPWMSEVPVGPASAGVPGKEDHGTRG